MSNAHAFPGNYPIELERRDLLRATARPFLNAVKGAFAAPRKLSCREWWRTENQGPVGRCAGMGSSSCGEWLYRAKTGKLIHFNGHWSYIKAQSYTPSLFGRDGGSTIHGNVEAAKHDGFCPEDWDGDGRIEYPLPPRYTTKLPPEAAAHATQFKAQGHSWIEDLEQWDAFLKSGQGPILVGAEWGNWGPDGRGCCDQFAGGGGGHAWFVCGWDDDRFGGSYEMVNSHGTRWGLGGFAYLTQRFVSGMLARSYTAAVGLSDLTAPEPRGVEWSEEGYL